ncbi:MAG TPA: hypothetical protein VLA61_22155 [Ideonella sp.]|uniref:TA system antitoxin ParD family protein n=1 Tax=Ideonella sp. TaxID=1929293 RepID=UPI002CCE54CC|nr:hypothetical protein [Ideonella sp.]HSI50977.1 hypothetical protein [Ideonella sp.]
MISNSIRIGATLFKTAQAQGALMSRSAAQQVEHWARIGAALESSGLSTAQIAALLRNADAQEDGTASDAALWAFKRAQQARDLAQVQSGRLAGDQLSWFAGGKAKDLRLIDSPY